ncbi:hypothetical protein ACFRJ9_19790 [Paenarthrobacter sp. NPDC056912]|uniref:hypothetical protein n=1 Tax=Paenarthrobacter sp. NPDC056912 TaxID=3345965 RepID=UPI00366FB57F
MSLAYDPEAIWLKAKLFISRTLDDDERSFDERVLWASLALELLAKSALARISPILIADPTEDGRNILAAAGLGEVGTQFTSVRASTIFARCKRVFPPFNADDALSLSKSRNEYVHGGGIGFGSVRPDKLWPTFWSLASTLIDAQDRSIEDLVGPSREAVVNAYLEQNNQYLDQRLQSLLSRAKQRYLQKGQGNLPEKVQNQWRSEGQLSPQLPYSTYEDCPACGNPGLLEAHDAYNQRVDGYFDASSGDEDSWGVADAASEYFSCQACQLVLDQFELIERSSLPDSFEVQGDEFVAEAEGEYGND